MDYATRNQTDKKAFNDAITIRDESPGDDFQVLIDEPFFSLVYMEGRYVADVKMDQTASADEQEAALTEVLRRARKFGLACFASHPHSSGWISLQFYKVEGAIDSFN